MNRIKIYNGKVITPSKIMGCGTVIIENGKIKQVTDKNVEVQEALLIDAQGKYISPGFIDMHVHGGGGHDFMDNTVEAFLEVVKTHARFGTTAAMPTTLSSEKEDLLQTISTYDLADKLNTQGAQFIGLHIEGPYFAMSQKGAQDPRYIRNPDPMEYKELIASSKNIKRWSAAPELPGALSFGKYLQQHQIMPAIAHTDAIYEEVVKAFEVGFTHATHFYSCMSGVSRRNARRYAGVIESAYLMDKMTVEIIADGIHLPAPLLKLIFKIKGVENVALITDAMRGAGMPEGKSILGGLKSGMEVIIEDGVAKLPDRTAFAGSVATANQLVRTMVELAEVTLLDAVRMATETPAKILKIDDHKGTLAEGKDADVVLFDSGINVHTTIVNGKIVFSKDDQF